MHGSLWRYGGVRVSKKKYTLLPDANDCAIVAIKRNSVMCIGL